MKNKKIKFRQSLFWDVDPAKIDLKKNARYIIERVLDFGRDQEVRWVWETYPRPLIRDVVVKSRGIFPKTRSLWELLTRRK